ncbi:MAG: hypothetical protein KDD22_04415, partial [Bdellovibrionales bacterium]|nr:hypothetical protein [Bdellovibrionales bacterium]
MDKDECYRLLHTLEGEAAAFSVETVRSASRECQDVLGSEDLLTEQKSQKFYEKLDLLKKGLSDFEIEHPELMSWLGSLNERQIEFSELDLKNKLNLAKTCTNLNKGIEFLEEHLLLVPLEMQLKKFNTVVQAAALKVGKKVHPLKVDAADLRIDSGWNAFFFSNLVHVFRNAVDHGIESEEARRDAGKDPIGTIEIKAFVENNFLHFEIRDDGSGVNISKVREVARSRLPEVPIDSLSDYEVCQLIFAPGFTSRDSVSELSGRGVGMDAVKSAVEDLGGMVEMRSEVGVGSRVLLKIPWNSNTEQLKASA